ncbi:MAG: hypothetical protein GDA45_01955 [Chromatiales bacterium]|nr:hypothetical protein [Chromatiales bacterium]
MPYQNGYPYPRSPKMNALNERFHRTIREAFVAYRKDLLMEDISVLNDVI